MFNDENGFRDIFKTAFLGNRLCSRWFPDQLFVKYTDAVLSFESKEYHILFCCKFIGLQAAYTSVDRAVTL